MANPLRLRGGMDAVQQHEFEVILERLQQPDATPQQRQHAQQFALLLQNPVDFAEIEPDQLAAAAGMMHSLACSSLERKNAACVSASARAHA